MEGEAGGSCASSSQVPPIAEAVDILRQCVTHPGLDSEWTHALSNSLLPLSNQSHELRQALGKHGWNGNQFSGPPNRQQLLVDVEALREGRGAATSSSSSLQDNEKLGFDPPPRQPPRNPTTDIAQKCHNADAQDSEGATKSFGKSSFSNEAPYRLQNVETAAAEEEEKDYDMQMNYMKVKSNDDFRVSYLQKLSHAKVYVPREQRPPKHQTVCIFDWDDTLLCTTFLNSCPGGRVPVVAQEQLRAIASNVKQMLEVSLQMGTTFIITNAMSGWVEHSAEKWIPEVLPVLQKVQVISARTKYEPDFPDEVGQWKIQAFLDVQQRLDTDMVTNLLSVGDSNFEMDAIHVMGSKFSQALIKTVKLKQSPSPLELIKQLDLIVPKFEQVVNSGRNLKILCERKGPDAQASKAGRK